MKTDARTTRKITIFLAVLALLSPLGLYLPELFHAGAAWGEWGIEEVKSMVGFEPAGLKAAENTWKAPVPAYGASALGTGRRGLIYLFSAGAGAAVCAGSATVLARLLKKRESAGK